MRKKFLSLVLAATMTMSLFVVGAGATSFKDEKDIVNKDAVDRMVSLNIINGRDNGQFDPKGTVTRAEMCKMICIALSGGNDPKLGSNSAVPASFTDTKGHWAEGYIEYCVNMNIVAGMGDKTFAPDKGVTPTQAAKMLLVALGYDADFEKFTGPTWAISTNRMAHQRDLYDEIQTIPGNDPMSRDNAAQMVNNFCDATMVKYEFGISGTGSSVTGVKQANDIINVVNGKNVYQTVLNKFYKLDDTITGILNDWTYDSDKREYKYSINTAGTDAANTIYKTDKDYTALFGQNVQLLFKDKNNDGKYDTNDEIYDISAKDSSKLMTGVLGELDAIKASDNDFDYDKVTYKLTGTAGAVKVYNFGENNAVAGKFLSDYDENAAVQQYTFDLIDNTGDDEGDIIVVHPYIVEKITYVDSKSVSTNNNTYKFEDCDIYKDIAKNDWVLVTKEDNSSNAKDTLKKLDKVNGTISSLKSSTKIVLDGTVYENAVGVTGDTTYKLGNKVELVVVNGYIFDASKLSTAVSNDKLLLVTKADPVDTGVNDGTQKISAVFADGSKKTITVDEIDDKDIKNVAPLATAEAGDCFFNYSGATGTHALNTMYAYSIDKDGNYSLDPLTGGTNGDYDYYKNATTASLKDGKFSITAGNTGTVRFADDAVVFYYDINKDEYKATTGAIVNKWSEYTSGNITGSVFVNENDGFYYTQVGFLSLNVAPSDKDTLYGYIVEKPDLVKDGDDYYYAIQVWNGKETVTLKAEETAKTSSITNDISKMEKDPNVQKGTPISYKASGDKIIDSVTSLASSVNAITAYTDGKSAVGFQNVVAISGDKELKITSDTVVIRFSSDKTESATGNGITTAKETIIPGQYIYNCYVVGNTDDEVEALIIDKDGSIGESTVAPVIDNVVIKAVTAPAGTGHGTISVVNLKTTSDLKTILTNATTAGGWGATTAAVVLKSDLTTAVADGTALAATHSVIVTAEDGTAYVYDIAIAP